MSETGNSRQSRYEITAPTVPLDTTGNSFFKKARAEYYPQTPSLESPIALTTILLLGAALTIVVVTSWFWAMPFGTGTRQIVLNVFLGMLLSLPVLISLWLVLSGQAWFVRIPLATFCLSALLGIFLTTMWGLEGPVPDELVLLLGGITLAVSAAIQAPLWVVRVRYGATISRTGAESKANRQFTIKQLLITTTALAFLVPLIQWIATFKIFAKFRQPLGEIFGFCGIFIVELVFLTLLSVLLVFVPKLRVASLCVLLVGLAAIPFVVVPSINYVIMGLEFSISEAYLMDTDMLINVFAFSLSNTVSQIVVLSMYYAFGFRLRTPQE